MSNPFIKVINSLLHEPQASLLNGILFGKGAFFPKSLYQDLITTGTLHIVALSGMNISILINFISKIIAGIGRKASSIFSICLIVIFVVFVGASPPVVRAGIMGSLSLIAVIFGRKNWALLSLVLASLIMLLFDFSLVKNISFQLSFLATLGILLADEKVDCQRKKSLLSQFIYALKINMKLTLSAQLFTLPVIIYHFHRISLIAPLANIMIEWVIQPIMILGFVTAIIGYFFFPLAIIPALATWAPLTYLIFVVQILAIWPGASIQF